MFGATLTLSLAQTQQIQEIHSPWTVAALVVVLLHQWGTILLQARLHRANTRELEGIKAELVECRARWDTVQAELGRLAAAQSLLARGIARPPESNQP
jgi:hypothetical protein